MLSTIRLCLFFILCGLVYVNSEALNDRVGQNTSEKLETKLDKEGEAMMERATQVLNKLKSRNLTSDIPPGSKFDILAARQNESEQGSFIVSINNKTTSNMKLNDTELEKFSKSYKRALFYTDRKKNPALIDFGSRVIIKQNLMENIKDDDWVILDYPNTIPIDFEVGIGGTFYKTKLQDDLDYLRLILEIVSTPKLEVRFSRTITNSKGQQLPALQGGHNGKPHFWKMLKTDMNKTGSFSIIGKPWWNMGFGDLGITHIDIGRGKLIGPHDKGVNKKDPDYPGRYFYRLLMPEKMSEIDLKRPLDLATFFTILKLEGKLNIETIVPERKTNK